MSKIIKNSKLYRLNVGSYSQEKAAGYFDLYSDTVGGIINQFVKNYIVEQEGEQMEGRRRGKIEEEVIDVGLNKEEEKLEI